jgi:hypothetical protein
MNNYAYSKQTRVEQMDLHDLEDSGGITDKEGERESTNCDLILA